MNELFGRRKYLITHRFDLEKPLCPLKHLDMPDTNKSNYHRFLNAIPDEHGHSSHLCTFTLRSAFLTHLIKESHSLAELEDIATRMRTTTREVMEYYHKVYDKNGNKM